MSASPEVAEAVAALRAGGVLTDEEAARPGRVARGELVSVRAELRAALYLGVLLLVSGVGLFLRENVDRIGPSAIAGAVGLASGACLAWAWRKAAPPSWGEAASTHAAFDYVLLLGALLAAADLAWVETQTPTARPGVAAAPPRRRPLLRRPRVPVRLADAPFARARVLRGVARPRAERRARVARRGRRRAAPMGGARDGRALRGRRNRDSPRGEEGPLRGRLGERGRAPRLRRPSVGRLRIGARLGGVARRAPRRLGRRRGGRVPVEAHAAVRAGRPRGVPRPHARRVFRGRGRLRGAVPSHGHARRRRACDDLLRPPAHEDS